MCAEGGAGMDLDWEEVDRRVRCAIAQLRDADRVLLEIDANERSITHRLAVLLESHFPEFDVDVEYNRVGGAGDPKRLDWNDVACGAGPEDLVRDTQARTVYPDIIVHRRTTEDNLLVIEVKKSSNAGCGERDRRKLEAFREDREFHYRHAAFLEIPVGEDFGGPIILERRT